MLFFCIKEVKFSHGSQELIFLHTQRSHITVKGFQNVRSIYRFSLRSLFISILLCLMSRRPTIDYRMIYSYEFHLKNKHLLKELQFRTFVNLLTYTLDAVYNWRSRTRTQQKCAVNSEMQAYNREHPYYYSYLQCFCQPTALSYPPQSHQYQPHFRPHFESQLQKPFQSSFSIESLLGGEKTSEVSMPSLASTASYIKKTDSSVEAKLKGLVERRRNNSSKVSDSFDNREKSTAMTEVRKAELFGKSCMALNVFWVFLLH